VEEVRKEINAHGAGVMRVTKVNGRWQVMENDPLNRRFTSATLMDLAGPMKGTEHVKTKFSPTGTQTRGTNNNCGNGYTPWGTYLTCEENWPGICRSSTGRFPGSGYSQALPHHAGVATRHRVPRSHRFAHRHLRRHPAGHPTGYRQPGENAHWPR